MADLVALMKDENPFAGTSARKAVIAIWRAEPVTGPGLSRNGLSYSYRRGN